MDLQVNLKVQPARLSPQVQRDAQNSINWQAPRPLLCWHASHVTACQAWPLPAGLRGRRCPWQSPGWT